MKSFSGVRKGAWTEEEDNLLKSCIHKHGEGKWHQVPLIAGLNRCRKSCRLRWLNYLKPNIKRGEFKDDEVDLIIRLHKLLGNRWSLIAGRLPGRTANDVKNYWNTRLRKKVGVPMEAAKGKTQKIVKTNVIRPRPRTFKRNLSLWGNPGIVSDVRFGEALCKPSFMSPPKQEEDGIMRWKNILTQNYEQVVDDRANFSISGSEEGNITDLWGEEIAPLTKVGELFVGDGNGVENGFAFDADELWNFLQNE